MNDLYKNSLTELSSMIHKKEVKPSEVCAAFLARYDVVEPKVNAFITLNRESMVQSAKKMDEQEITAETPALFGIPIAIKDNICTNGLRTTCASKMLEDFIPPYDATIIKRLKENGAVVMGKADMDEFAMGSSTETSFFAKEGKKGRVNNPYKHDSDTENDQRVPGGSSGGSAAAVASGSAPVAIGSDTGGSIRLPAAYCGLVGYKPTYGAVSRHGLMAYASSFDQAGTIARTVTDAAIVTSAIAGHDPLDATSSPTFNPNFLNIEGFDVKGKIIGIISECFEIGISDNIKQEVFSAQEVFKSLGAEIINISVPLISECLSIYYILAMAEASSNFAKFDGVRFGYRSNNVENIDELYINSRTEGFGDEVKRRIWMGTYLLSEGQYKNYYEQAKVARAALREQFKQVFQRCDVLFIPSSPNFAPKFGIETGADMSSALDRCTVPVNTAGLPAISLPCAIKNGLPIGFQLVGKWFDDVNLLGFARAFEKGTSNKWSNMVAEVISS